MCNKSRNKEYYTNLILSYCQTLLCSPVEIQISITEAEYNTKSSLNWEPLTYKLGIKIPGSEFSADFYSHDYIPNGK